MSNTTASSRPPGASTRRPSVLKVVGVPVAAALVVGVAGAAVLSLNREPDRASAAARTFLTRYVRGDGRVERTDQGGDTVSEGQAYAMLLAVATDDVRRFDRIWLWTREHLQRPDGLLSWHWGSGQILDAQPAADADLDAVRALLIASRRFDRPAYEREANRMARAVLENETIRAGDELVLAAGPWAVGKRLVNPSYFAPRTFSEIQDATRDRRWNDLSAGSVRLLRELMRGGRLPPEWGRVTPAGDPVATERRGSRRYGLEAPRALLRLAESCDPQVRSIASRAAPAADGAAKDAIHPVTLVGAAAAARAAGDPRSASVYLDEAQAAARAHPTYYGWALVAIGRIALQTDLLDAC